LLFTTDLKAVTHVLTKSNIYEKQDRTQRMLASIAGWGVLVAEGDKHHTQRKIINPAFGPAHIRDQTGIYLDKANEVHPLLPPMGAFFC
jgi:cytochrome P450